MKPETRKAQRQRWYQRHKQERYAYRKKRLQDPIYAAKQRAYYQDYQRRWYQQHREERLVYKKRYYQAHVETLHEYKKTSRNRLSMRWYRWWKKYQWQPLPRVEETLNLMDEQKS